MTSYTSLAHARLSAGWTVIPTEAARLRSKGELCPLPAALTAGPSIGSPVMTDVTTAFRAFVDATNQPLQGSNRPAPPG